MKKLLQYSAALFLSAWALTSAALADDSAKVTLTVTHFRSMNPVANTDFIDATTSLAPHAAVTLVDSSGMPTLRVKRAINIEIRLASADGSESYRPLGILLRQKTDRAINQADPEGRINFASHVTPEGTIVLQHKFLQQGDDSRYEFFVLVQRASDGAIGVIDPDIVNEEE